MKAGIMMVMIIVLFLISCNNSKTDKTLNHESKKENTAQNGEDIKLEDIIADKSKDNSNVEFIDFDCVCFAQMTDMECDSLEEINPESYEIISEHLNNESTRVYELLEKFKIKNVWTNKRIICFKANNTEIYIDTRRKDLLSKCLIFSLANGLQIIDSEYLDESTIENVKKKN